MKNHILVIGSGGREHAIAKAFAKSQHVAQVFVAPGNPGMTLLNHEGSAPIHCVPISVDDFASLRHFVQTEGITLTFVGPEGPLSQGIVDEFKQHGLAIVGPSKAAAQLEASKSFAKEVMAQAGVPTAAYQTFEPHEITAAKHYAHQQGLPLVLKQDGLAAGKGVVIAQTTAEIEDTLEDMMVKQNCAVVIEEFMQGEEFSVFTFVNGTHLIPLGVARDHKRAYDQDLGPNTGGMGAYSPVSWVHEDLHQVVLDQVVAPLAKQMQANGTPYTGVLYSGLMLTASGPKVVEFNARFGDPETEILLPLIESDFFELVQAHLNQTPYQVACSKDICLGVILAAEGYPNTYQQGMPIHWPSDFPLEQVCFAGVKQDETGQLVASGGRILMVTARHQQLESCRQMVYQLMEQLQVAHTYYRKDIGLSAEV